MNRDDAVGRIQRVLGFRGDRSTEIIDALQDAQIDLELRRPLPWFLKTEVAAEDTVANEERVALPTDFLEEWDDDALWYFDSAADDEDKWTLLQKEDLQTLRSDPDLAGSDKPLFYAYDGLYFRIFPTPDAIYPLRMIYFQQDTLLTSNIENLWLKNIPTLIIGEAGLKMTTPFRDPIAATEFTRMRAEGTSSLVVATESKQHTNRRYVMGGPD